MKKMLLMISLILVAILCSACDVSGVALFYSETVQDAGFTYAINKNANCCFVSDYVCTEYADNMEITIPDEYDGIPITRMGGYFGVGAPMPFHIDIAEVYMNAPEGSEHATVYNHLAGYIIKEPYTIVDLPFVLNIGKNISNIDNVDMDVYYPHINEDGTIILYHPVVEIVCSKENKNFYSKDGKLYDKKTDELIDDFEYGVEVDREMVIDSFSFSFTWNTYGVSSYDSETGRLVKTTDATRPSDYVTTMYLSEDALVEIYTMLLKMDINSYPDSYDPINAPDAETIIKSEPSKTIILEVYGESIGKSIRCSDIAFGADGYDAKARAFLDACNRIEEIITDTKEWKALPEYEVFYE